MCERRVSTWGLWEDGVPHPLPQPFGLCALGLQLLPPLGGGGVGLSQGACQLAVAVLQREELGLPLHLAHGAVGTRGRDQGSELSGAEAGRGQVSAGLEGGVPGGRGLGGRG